MHIKAIETILYVKDQSASCGFYTKLLRKNPELNVPGMTSFELSENCKVGLMPNKSIASILSGATPHPADGEGIPRCELYLVVEDVQLECNNAIKAGARVVSAVSDRNWGDRVGYFADPDGHIIAFAQRIRAENHKQNHPPLP